jgi:DNA-binding response OmpR family regulator
MIVNILVFASHNFNKSLEEIKNKLNYNLIFYDPKDCLKPTDQNYHILFVDNEFLSKQKVDLAKLKKFNLPILLLIDPQSNTKKNILLDDQVFLPFNILELKKKSNHLLSSFKFSKNSSVNIKNYTIDKNLKTMRKENISINLTEKEVNLLVLLNEGKKPLNKKFILKKIWQYSIDADTHTLETHIYRLRKKVLDNFGDKEFINVLKEGYSL